MTSTMTVTTVNTKYALRDKERQHVSAHKRKRSSGYSYTTGYTTAKEETQRTEMIETTETDTTSSKRSRGASPSPSLLLHLPYRANWFRLDCIDIIEKKSLPEFFPGKSNTQQHKHTQRLIQVSLFPAPFSPQSYVLLRNGMVLSAHTNPGQNYSATLARKQFNGAATAILRVHSFLTHWGIINHHATSSTD